MDSIHSQPITWAEAQEMRDAYLANPRHLKTPGPSPMPGNYVPLKGYKVSSQALLNVINGTGPTGAPLQPPSGDVRTDRDQVVAQQTQVDARTRGGSPPRTARPTVRRSQV